MINYKSLFWLVFFYLVLSCSPLNIDNKKITGHINKWYNGKDAALSITYDSATPSSRADKLVIDQVISHKLTLDYEVINLDNAESLDIIKNKLLPLGFGVFGHGSRHINYDEVPYNEAYYDFKENFNTLKNKLGIYPITYAYPGGYGYKDSTVLALKDAGFISSRMHNSNFHSNPFIKAKEHPDSTDWFRLPSLVMQALDFQNDSSAINSTKELLPYLDKAVLSKSWIIISHHSIGIPTGWGYYDMSEFKQELIEIKKRPFWVAPMSEITKYAKQFDASTLELEYDSGSVVKIMLDHNINKNIYNHEMSITIVLPDDFLNRNLLLTHKNELDKHLYSTDIELNLNLNPSSDPYTLTISN